MIVGFADPETEAFFLQGARPRGGWQGVAKIAARKLDMLNAAALLTDLRSPPNNRLEQLKGDRAGQHSIRINDQWRVCFVWTEIGPSDVAIVDYHD